MFSWFRNRKKPDTPNAMRQAESERDAFVAELKRLTEVFGATRAHEYMRAGLSMTEALLIETRDRLAAVQIEIEAVGDRGTDLETWADSECEPEWWRDRFSN